ncbi:hypothetical protein KFZ56_06730 [Virgibacillus sp. NKC19-3]|uniref:LptM family lipoprotein n=1 Tax=Virgibacillus saliphilus TaxID=2831674 RepID=UPI001C9AAA29|nr:hypothetical protein [Virgibacillus sp. NKC19-3]MBY7142760.1 hypothetical protein [Virgibacillus sp. NKC19-3]
MKKILFSAVLIIVLGLLAACGESDNAENESSETEDTGQNEEDPVEEENRDRESYEFNQEIADNDNYKATLISIEKNVGEEEEWIDVNFEVENKLEDTVDFQASEVSINGKMVDQSLVMMSTEVAGGKVADAVLTIEDIDGGELPALEGDFEMLLNMVNWEDMEQEEQSEVSVAFE